MHRSISKLPIFLATAMAAASVHASLVTYTSLSAFNAAATNNVVVENFESVFPKNAPLGSLSHNGINYTPFAGVPSFNVWVAGPGYINFGTPATATSVLTANGNEDWLMTFAGTSAVGFDTYLNQYGPATLRAYGVSGLLGTYTLNHNPAQVGFWGITSDADAIVSIRWTTVLGGLINTGIDNIRMGSINPALPESVPEPSGLALLGLGMAAVIWLGRKRVRRASQAG